MADGILGDVPVPHFNTFHGRCSKKADEQKWRTYKSFCNAKWRCTNPGDPTYDLYGGRGIEFRFESIEELVRDIGERPTSKHSIDRIDSNGHYERGNVKWSTSTEQIRNRRTSLQVELNGYQVPLIVACQSVGLPYKLVAARLRRGWSSQAALSIPLIQRPIIHVNGEGYSVADLSRKSGLSYKTILTRIKAGWAIEEALTAPVRSIRHKKKG